MRVCDNETARAVDGNARCMITNAASDELCGHVSEVTCRAVYSWQRTTVSRHTSDGRLTARLSALVYRRWPGQTHQAYLLEVHYRFRCQMGFVEVLLDFRALSATASAANVTDFQATSYPDLCDRGERALQWRAMMVNTHAGSM